MKKILTFIKYVFGWPLSLIALFFVGRLLIGKTTLLQLHTLNVPLIVLSLFCFVVFFFLRVFFWQKLLLAKEMEFSFKETASTWGFSELKRYIPGGIWPILARSSAYSKKGGEQKALLASILQEAEFLGIACITLSLLSLNFLLFGILSIPYSIVISVLGGIFITACIGIFIFHQSIFPKRFQFLKHLLPDFSPDKMVYLLSIMAGAFFFFGLGTFFAIDSLTTLFLPHILSLSGFFVFTFLAGYVSFFAPMGLGVREGIMTIGLSKYISLADSALGSIIARILQTIAEVIFLLICIIWQKIPTKKIQSVETFVLQKRHEIFLIFLTTCYISYFTLASFLRYINFFTGRFDLGNMDQTVWNTIHGRIFQLTNPDGTNIITRLAFHADFMLVLLSPFYLLWQDPRMLLLLQTIAIGIGALLVFAIAHNTLKNKSLSLAFAASYLLYPTLQYANLFDFHPVTIAIPFILGAWYFVQKNKLWWAAFFIIIAATTKEEVWVVAGLFGLYFLFWKKKYLLGSMLSIFSFSIFYYLFFKAIPQAHGGDHFALSYYSDFGSTPGGVIKNIFLTPFKTLGVLFGKGQLFYLTALFGPVIFLPLFALPFLIFAGPDLAISLLSQNAQLHSIYYHYGAIPTPFIFIASIYGFAFLYKRVKYFSKIGACIILIPAIVFAYLFGPLPGAYHMSGSMFTDQLPYATLIDNFLSSIPRRYSVAATNNVGSHLSHRQKIYTIPVGLKEADIVVFLLDDSFAQPSLLQQRQMAKDLDTDPAYVKLFSYKDFVVYKKRDVPTYNRIRTRSILPLFKGN